MKILRGENGVAILQVVFVGMFVMITGLLFMKFMDNNDRNALRLVRRNQNLNNSIDMANFLVDRKFVKGAARTLKSRAGTPELYQ